MGKKTDSKQILQIGKKNNSYVWDSKYFENDIKESQIYLSQSIEIKQFLKTFLNSHNLNLYKYDINFSLSKLKIFISYFKTSRIKDIIPRISDQYKFRLVRKLKVKRKNLLYSDSLYKRVRISNSIKLKGLKMSRLSGFLNFLTLLTKQFLLVKQRVKTQLKFIFFIHKIKKLLEQKMILIKLYSSFFDKLKSNFITKKKLKLFFNKYLIKRIISIHIQNFKINKLLLLKYKNYFKNFLIKYFDYKKLFKTFLTNKKLYKKRLRTLRYYKIYEQMKSNKTVKSLKTNNFLNKLNESLKIFTKNKFENVLILQQINKNITFNLTYRQLQSLKKLTTQLRRFKNAKFFNEGVNVILSSLINLNSIDLLANFISRQLSLSKRHGLFFKFLVKTLSSLLKYKFSKVKSVKILIKGRINGKPRANKKMIFINKRMSLMTIESPIIFTQSTSSSLSGSFGVKLWVNT